MGASYPIIRRGVRCRCPDLDAHQMPPCWFAQILKNVFIDRMSAGEFRKIHQHGNASHPLGLLRARRKRPRGRSADEKRYECAPLHSITSSAVARSDGGTVRPSSLAVWALITSSNLLDCTTGRSAGLAPLRMRPA